jgi:hypothetical protein
MSHLVEQLDFLEPILFRPTGFHPDSQVVSGTWCERKAFGRVWVECDIIGGE